AEGLWGLRETMGGSVSFEKREISSERTEKLKALGFSYIPEDRHSDGLILDFSLFENFYLGSQKFYKNPFLIPGSQLKSAVESAIQNFDIKSAGFAVPVRSLSG